MKNWFRSLFSVGTRQSGASDRAPWPPVSAAVPWSADRPSIHGFLVNVLRDDRDRSLPLDLPDEEFLAAKRQTTLRWAAGASDGVFGHHRGAEESDAANLLFKALQAVLRDSSAKNLRYFYDLAIVDDIVNLVDPLLDRIRASQGDIPPDRLRELARWLAMESPDRGAVKLAIALSGVLSPAQDTAMLTTLGRHEEFTLYSMVALRNTLPASESEDLLWSMAKEVDGWGRVHIVERLADTQRADIKAWLLREGYRNAVMFEYLAYPCAVGGELSVALQPDVIDEALLIGAGDILDALINGGPAKDMSDYDDGAVATRHYLRHVHEAKPNRLEALLAVQAIASFLGQERGWTAYEARGWSPAARTAMSASCQDILSEARWVALAQRALAEAHDDAAFWVAAAAAETLGLDAWPARYARQESGHSSQWFHLMRTRDPERIDRVIGLAGQQLDLARIASGPGTEMGMGPSFQDHSALDFILQELGEFPGKGPALVAAGLRSPVIRNRNMALRTLEQWGSAHWPEGTLALLHAALREEPEDALKARIKDLMATSGA